MPGLAAKPIIDVLVTVEEVEPDELYVTPLVALGYELRVREEGHRMFRPSARDVHVHVWAEGSEEAREYLVFRDSLRASLEARDEYERLKRELASRDWPDVNYYAQAKGPLIAQILDRARRH